MFVEKLITGIKSGRAWTNTCSMTQEVSRNGEPYGDALDMFSVRQTGDVRASIVRTHGVQAFILAWFPLHEGEFRDDASWLHSCTPKCYARSDPWVFRMHNGISWIDHL